ncbi:hypothetical protein SAMN02746065_10931 [Desulfocicer vacuolatum DSM 3385]|uniref:Uncharacterized protein n=1 Tax=Desulfocicer vacuolatum DSM 3385 TaxID=1121400 RepID=A0A1W2BPA0_9BACT|nr:hypothetical protein [Desulfocicer vacuolatum]SMC74789.1 hypothetical protein SAMN02746065_10931 [Desulfocicer vacuolatum DSM 3385]
MKILIDLRYHGKSRSPFFDDPITRHLMNHRWRYYAWAAHVKEDDLKWLYRDFIRAYKAQVAGGMAGCFPARLPLEDLAQKITRGEGLQQGYKHSTGRP